MLRKLLVTDENTATVILRFVLGVVFFAHGAQKMLGWFGGYGFSGTMFRARPFIDQKPFQVSRNHLSIDRWEQGRFVVRDRGSFLGTLVNGHHIGGTSRRRIAELKPGENTLIVGSEDSPYKFAVSVPVDS